MMHELIALRALEKEVASYVTAMGFSPKREGLQNALAAIAAARDKDGTMSADAYGEMMRTLLFVGEGYGCYSNFDVHPDLRPVDKSSALGVDLLRALFSSCAWYGAPDSKEHEASEVARAQLYASQDYVLAWWWDGDGTLLVGGLDEQGKITCAALNDDCKKDYGWLWVECDVYTLTAQTN